jgi:hypothetical protein
MLHLFHLHVAFCTALYGVEGIGILGLLLGKYAHDQDDDDDDDDDNYELPFLSILDTFHETKSFTLFTFSLFPSLMCFPLSPSFLSYGRM